MPDEIDHSQRAHSRIGPSSSERVWNCAASVQMIEQHGIERPAGASAIAGTSSHEQMDRALRKQGAVQGDDDMAEAARLGVVTVETDVTDSGPDHVLLIEQRVDLARHHPELFGSMDAALFDPARRKLFVYDLKTGRALVEADALQLQLYAAMTLEHLGARADCVETVETVVIQPYAPHPDGAVRRARHTRASITNTAAEYVTRAWRATDSNEMPEAVAGKWCKWCAAKGSCKAFRDEQTRRAMLEFGPAGELVKMLPPANDLPLETLGNMLTAAWMLKPWIAAIEERALFVMDTMGVSVPGYYLKDKRATRKWMDPERAEKRLRSMGVPSNKLYDLKFISPAQAEKVLAMQDRHAIADLIVSESSGKTLAAHPYVSQSVNMDQVEN